MNQMRPLKSVMANIISEVISSPINAFEKKLMKEPVIFVLMSIKKIAMSAIQYPTKPKRSNISNAVFTAKMVTEAMRVIIDSNTTNVYQSPFGKITILTKAIAITMNTIAIINRKYF